MKQIQHMNKMRLVKTSIAIGLALSLSACALTERLLKNETNTNNADQNSLTNAQASLQAPELTQALWWSKFNDPQLDQLIQTAVEQNKNLAAAEQRFQASLARLRIEKNQYYPQGGIEYSGARSRALNSNGNIEYSTQARAGLGLQWELDLFGRIAGLVNAAKSDIQLAQYTRLRLQTEIIAGVSQSYFALQTNEQRLKIAKQQVNTLEKGLDLLNIQLEEGQVSALDIHRTQAQISRQKALIPQIELARLNNLKTLSDLTSQPYQQLNISVNSKLIDNALLRVKLNISEADKAIELRPDVQVAKANMVKNLALSDSAAAAIYPTISINGFAGLQADNFGLSDSSRVGNIGPQINWSIFNLSALKAQAKASENNAIASVLAYEQSVINAITDIEVSLASTQATLAQAELLNQRLDFAQQATDQAQIMYEEGLIPYLELLDAIREVLLAEDEAISSKADYVNTQIAAYKALSASWLR